MAHIQGTGAGHSKKFLSYPSTLGDNNTTLNFNSHQLGGEAGGPAGDTREFADLRNDNTDNTGNPFIMFEFIKIDYSKSTNIDISWNPKKAVAGSVHETNVTEGISVNYTPDQEEEWWGLKSWVEGQRVQWNKAFKAWKPKRFVSDTVILYMTPSISVGDSMNYHEDTRKLAASLEGVLEGGADYFKNQSRSDLATVAIESAAGIGALIGNQLGGVASTILGGSIADAFKGEAEIARGKTLNPNEYLRYKSTGLRSFSFDFKFLPDSKDESVACREIIKQFRTSAHASKESDITVKVPDQVVLSFHGVRGMIQLPPLVISSTNVTYGPTGATVFREDNAPVEMTFSVTLQEVVPIYQEDVGEGY